MPDLSGQAGELRFTLEITRAATGLTETVELIGKITEEEAVEILESTERM